MPRLFINEVDGLARYGTEVLHLLRSLSEEQVCQVVMVGYHGAYGATQSITHPFFNWVKGHSGEKAFILGQLTPQAAYQLLDQLEFSKLRLRWQDRQTRTQGRDLLMQQSYRIPIMLQAVCQRLVDRLHEQRRMVIRMEDLTGQEGPYPVWDYLNKIRVSLKLAEAKDVGQPGSHVEETAQERHWREIVTAVLIQHLYYKENQPKYTDGELIDLPSPDFKFSVAQSLRLVENWLERVKSPDFPSILRQAFKADDYRRLFEQLTLTVMMAPVPNEHGRFHFQDHIYPIELGRYLRRNGIPMEGHISQLIEDLFLVLEI